MKTLIGALTIAAGLVASTLPGMAQPYYGSDGPPPGPRAYGRDYRDEYYASRGRNAPYYEERKSNGRSSKVRTMEADPRGGTIEREIWTDHGRKVTRRTFTDPQGNKRVIIDRY